MVAVQVAAAAKDALQHYEGYLSFFRTDGRLPEQCALSHGTALQAGGVSQCSARVKTLAEYSVEQELREHSAGNSYVRTATCPAVSAMSVLFQIHSRGLCERHMLCVDRVGIALIPHSMQLIPLKRDSVNSRGGQKDTVVLSMCCNHNWFPVSKAAPLVSVAQ